MDGVFNTRWRLYNEDETELVESGEKKSTFGGSNLAVLCTTGANIEKNNIKNICDIAGNVWEWTVEKFYDSYTPCVARGGGCDINGRYNPVGIRYGDFADRWWPCCRLPCCTLLKRVPEA